MSTAQQTSVEERLDRIESTFAIQRLMDDYAFGCDRKDRDRFMGVFHDDAEYIIPGDFGTSNGSAEIEAVLNQIWEGVPETHHWITNVTVNFTGEDAAAGDAHTVVHFANAMGHEGWVSAYYTNSYERRDGVWRATSIELDVHWWKTAVFGSLPEA